MNHRTIIFDIDGVIADCDHRLHHILEGKKDWDAFDAAIPMDKPIYNCIRLLWAISHNPFIDIILLTSRSEQTRKLTEDWLHCQDVPYSRLEMRKDGDHRPAPIIKLERLDQLPHCQPADVVTIFEDHPGTIEALRNAGYHVCDPGTWGWKGINQGALVHGGRDEN